MAANTTPRHRVFLSFHHANDEQYKLRFEELFHASERILHSRSVNDGDINPRMRSQNIRKIIRDDYLGSSTVTVMLVGTGTWRRKHVDWEIASSLRNMPGNRRSGLVGLVLPNRWHHDLLGLKPATMPQRLVENVRHGYARLYRWTEDAGEMARVIHEAWLRRDGPIGPKVGQAMMRQNISDSAKGWS